MSSDFSRNLALRLQRRDCFVRYITVGVNERRLYNVVVSVTFIDQHVRQSRDRMDGPKNEDQTYVSVRIEFRSPHVARIRFRRAAFSGAECTYIRRNTSRPLSGPQIFSLLRVNVKGCGFTMIRGSTESTIPARYKENNLNWF